MAGIVFSAYFVVRGSLQFGVGHLSDRYGRDFALSLCMIAGAVGLTVFVCGPGLAAVAVATVLAGLGASFFPALDPRFLNEIGDEDTGSEFGLVRTIYVMVGSTGSIGVGLLVDLFGWPTAFLVFAVLSCFTFCTLLVNRSLERGY